jgi:aminoglycoside phosphotransferase (APT) family kinase protein
VISNPGPEHPGLDAAAVSAWLADHVDRAVGPFDFALVAAGGSNLTYRVTDANGRSWALRRPPVAAVLATAHDMDREWRIIDALSADGNVPVPTAVARCDDIEVTGAPFYVMEFVDGTILRTDADGAALDAAAADVATDSLVDVQVSLHALDPDAIGLGGLGKPGSYAERQLHRWHAQVERAGVRELPLLEEIHARLVATVPPPSGRPVLAHGDYRFDNTVLGDDHRIIAVLDWELCTTGDAVADFAWSLLYWADPGDPCQFLASSPTLAPVFPRRAEVAERYATRSGRSLDALDWYLVFGYWKMACIVEGVHARYLRGGTGGGAAGDASSIAGKVDALLEHAHELAGGAHV